MLNRVWICLCKLKISRTKSERQWQNLSSADRIKRLSSPFSEEHVVWTDDKWCSVHLKKKNMLRLYSTCLGTLKPCSNCQPKSDLCISGWNMIWITDCPHSILQLFISDLWVHKRFVSPPFFTECALVSMVMPLPCYAYAKTTVTAIQIAIQMSFHRGCAVVLYFVLWGSGRNAGSCAALFRAAVSTIFLFFCLLLLSK